MIERIKKKCIVVWRWCRIFAAGVGVLLIIAMLFVIGHVFSIVGLENEYARRSQEPIKDAKVVETKEGKDVLAVHLVFESDRCLSENEKKYVVEEAIKPLLSSRKCTYAMLYRLRVCTENLLATIYYQDGKEIMYTNYAK